MVGDQFFLPLVAILLNRRLSAHGSATIRQLLLINERDRAVGTRVAAAPASVVFGQAASNIGCPASVICTVGAAHDVDKWHYALAFLFAVCFAQSPKTN